MTSLDPDKAEPTIPEVFDCLAGTHRTAQSFFDRAEHEVLEDRRANEHSYQSGNARFLCAECNKAVKIVGKVDGIVCMHFKHIRRNPECPFHSESGRTPGGKFRGAQEGYEHRRLKKAIANVLRIQFGADKVWEERRICSPGDPQEWRKPDVLVEMNGKLTAIELQLSTTFLNVIVEREIFYDRHDIRLLWVFRDAPADPAELRLTFKDVLTGNHGHAYLFNADAEMRSLGAGKLLFNAQVQRFTRAAGWFWEAMQVGIEDVKWGFDKRPWVVDVSYDRVLAKAENRLQRIVQSLPSEAAWRDGDAIIQSIAGSRITMDYQISRLFRALVALRLSRPIWSSQRKLIEMMHSTWRRDYAFSEVLLKAITTLNRDLVMGQDPDGKFIAKAKLYRASPCPQREDANPLLEAVFPEVMKALREKSKL